MRGLVLPLAVVITVCAVVTGSAYVIRVDPAAEPQQVADLDMSRPRLAFIAPASAVPAVPAVPTATAVAGTGASATPATPITTTRPPRSIAAAPPPAAAPAPRLPLPYSGSAGQMITVVGASSTAITAQLTAWTRNGDGWTRAIGPVTANVGRAGIGRASESTSRTPAGVFGLTEAFGILADNGTRLPYRRVDTSDWWVSDVGSPAYNTHYRCAPGSCPFDEGAGENLGRVGTAYHHAVVIDYNRFPVTPGAGSAFFLHVSTGGATAGCVAVPAAVLDTIMRWLDPTRHPVINIGVG